MKALIASAISLALCAPALATLAPVERQLTLRKIAVAAIYTGPAGAQVEHDYFQSAPQPTATRRIFPCSVRVIVFEKTQLARSCD